MAASNALTVPIALGEPKLGLAITCPIEYAGKAFSGAILEAHSRKADMHICGAATTR